VVVGSSGEVQMSPHGTVPTREVARWMRRDAAVPTEEEEGLGCLQLGDPQRRGSAMAVLQCGGESQSGCGGCGSEL
jgi:hypothetical protein